MLHLFLTILGIALVGNFAVTPWKTLESYRWIVVPYVLVASWVGYLAGYWYIVLQYPQTHRPHPQKAVRLRLARIAYLSALAAAVFASALLNHSRTDARRGDAAQEYAQLIVKRLNGRGWIVGAGNLMDTLRIEIFEAGVPAEVLDLGLLSHKAYQTHLLTILPHPELTSLVEAGPVALLKQWLRMEPSFKDELAVVYYSDLIHALDKEAVPSPAFYTVDEALPSVVSPDLFLQDFRSTWNEAGALAASARSSRDPTVELVGREISAHLSKLANDTGVLLEDLGYAPEAVEAYAEARNLNPGNVVALANLYSLTDRLKSVQHEEIKGELESYLRDNKSAGNLLQAARIHGTLRDPLAFRELGIRSATAGESKQATLNFERALQLGARAGGVRGVLGNLYFLDDRQEESRKQFNAILAHNPTNVEALVGMARLSAREQSRAEAESFLERASTAGAQESRIRLERVALETLLGNAGEARNILKGIVERSSRCTDRGAVRRFARREWGNKRGS